MSLYLWTSAHPNDEAHWHVHSPSDVCSSWLSLLCSAWLKCFHVWSCLYQVALTNGVRWKMCSNHAWISSGCVPMAPNAHAMSCARPCAKVLRDQGVAISPECVRVFNFHLRWKTVIRAELGELDGGSILKQHMEDWPASLSTFTIDPCIIKDWHFWLQTPFDVGCMVEEAYHLMYISLP